MEMTLEKAFYKTVKEMKWNARQSTQRTYAIRDLFAMRESQLTAKAITDYVVNLIKEGKPKTLIYSFNYLIKLCFEHGFKKDCPAENLSISYLCKKYKVTYSPPQKKTREVAANELGVAFKEVSIKDALPLLAGHQGRYGEIVAEVIAWAKRRKEGKSYLVQPPENDNPKQKNPYGGLRSAIRKGLHVSGLDDLKIGWNQRERVCIVYSKKERASV